MKIQFRGHNFELPQTMRKYIISKVPALERLSQKDVKVYLSVMKFQCNVKLEVLLYGENQNRIREESISNDLDSALLILNSRLENRFKKLKKTELVEI
ncbi:HPF/RaiA family ribosome-associated protein [Priestia aryabhattai]|uniref:HPF/RaiA family ribosome-associated protein n=1 Tax=Priestia aryabhattai TaxID=412384 RepID=A0AAX6NC98_PRIAR|nr:HPF/RaiA family ribosome-associated protein [Priestia aryabhattai]MDU9693531.1 HPF/RaiA family ribosome-associated protein [Priestia aryabhattai]NGY88061.1 HPF/RaiA family ribosome-associated protein [Priestia megaterium]